MRKAISVSLDFQHVLCTQIVTVMQQIVDARGAVRLFPAVREIRFVIWPHDACIGRENQSTFWIKRLRELFERDVARPFVVVRIAGNGYFATALFPNRHSRSHEEPDVAFNIGIDRILSRAPYALHGFVEFFPGVGFAQPVVAVGESARLGRSPAQRVAFVSLAKNDRAVSRYGNFQVFVRLTFDANDLVGDLRFRPRALYAVPIRGGGVECFDVKILNVGAVISEAPGDTVVMADDDHRRAGQREAFDVPARCGEMNLVPDRRYRELEMRVIGEQGFPSHGVGAAYYPVVADKALPNFGLRLIQVVLNGFSQRSG